MTDEGYELLESPRREDHVTYLAPTYGGGRFRTVRTLARAGQGYAVLVEDVWSGSRGVLKGLWWERQALKDPRRSAVALQKTNLQIQQGVDAARRATQLSQQAPTVVETLTDPSPSLQVIGHPEPLVEYFVVQQFVGAGWTPARTLRDQISERARTGQRFTELELLDLASQLCDTLAAVHTERSQRQSGRRTYWVHADVKPENILVLGPPWRYVLIDYDGAVEKDSPIPLTTPEYAPPRRPDGYNPEEDKASERFDIYMFGATLAEAAGLGRLDESVRRDLYGAEERHIEGKSAIREMGYGPILTTVIASCLAAPGRRLGSAGVVAADLARARNACVLSNLLLSERWS